MSRKAEVAKKKNAKRRFVKHNTRRDRQRVARLKKGLCRVFEGVPKWHTTVVAYLVVALSVGKMLGVRALGEAMPGGAGLKHRIKRVWRFLRNDKVDYRLWCANLLNWTCAGMAWKRAGVREVAWKGQPHQRFRKGFRSGLKRLGADGEAVEYLIGHYLGLVTVYTDPEFLPLREAVDLIPPLATFGQVVEFAS